MSNMNKGLARATTKLDDETAALNDLWGWRWASVTVGPQAADASVSSPAENAAAPNFAITFIGSNPAPVFFARLAVETLLTQVMEAYQATLPLLNKAQAARSVPLVLWSEVDDLLRAGEHLARAAVQMQNTLAFVSTERGGEQ